MRLVWGSATKPHGLKPILRTTTNQGHPTHACRNTRSILLLLFLFLLLFLRPGFLQRPGLHAATPGPTFVESLQFLHLLGILRGQVAHLGTVGVDVVEFPAAGMLRDELPPALA